MKLNAAGWLAVIVIAVLVLSGAMLVGRALWVDVRGLDTLQPMSEYTPQAQAPTATLRPTATATAGPPTPEPTPDGWTVQTDLAGEEYLAPPPAVEAEIREAFEAVLRCILVRDAPNDEILTYDRQAVYETAARLAVPEVLGPSFGEPCRELVEGRQEENQFAEVFICDKLGPENPVQCTDYDTCILGRTRQRAAGVLIFDVPEGARCDTLVEDELGSMCLIRNENLDSTPNVLFVAKIEYRGGWIVTEWSAKSLPE